jgi:hypothetical protein
MKPEDLIPEVYKVVPGEKCSVCGRDDRPVAYRIIEYGSCDPAPVTHIPIMGVHGGYFPMCEDCAPPCRKCGLPVRNATAKKYFRHICKVRRVDHPTVIREPIQWGSGICQHKRFLGLVL